MLIGIRVRLALLIGLVAIPLAALLIYNYREQRTMEEEKALDQVQEVVRLIAREEQNLIEASRELLIALQQAPSIWRAPPEQCGASLANLLAQYRRYANFGVLEPDGTLYCSAVPPPGRLNFSDRTYFRRVLETRSFAIGDYQIGAIVRKPVLVAAYPIVDANSRVERVLYASISLDWLNREDVDILRIISPGATLTKVDTTGRIFVRVPDPGDWVGKQFPDKAVLGIALGRSDGTARAAASDGRGRLYAFAPLFDHAGNRTATVILDIPEASVVKRVEQMITVDLILGGIVVLAAISGAWLLGNTLIARTASRLASVADQLRRGNLSARTGLPHHSDEFGRLARGFDDMAASLEQREAALRAEEEKYRLLVENANEGVFVVQDGVFKLVNPKLADILGYAREEFIGREFLDFIHDEDRPPAKDRYRKCIEGDEVTTISVVRLLTKDNQTKWVESNVAPTRWNKAPAVLGFVTDITERVAAEERLAYLAQHDPLTGLANRSLFVDRMERALVRAERHGRHVGVLYLDLDRFQTINDALGHAAGDEVLKVIAGRMSGAVRSDDTVARVAGDEFGVLLEDIASPTDVADVAQKLLHTVMQPLQIAQRDLHLTASIGISVGPTDASSADALLVNAGLALDAAKARGKNTLQFYSPLANTAAAERRSIEDGLYRAVQKQEFTLHYQPRVELTSGIIVGAEALLRWRQAEQGFVSPGKFIPVLEQTPLIGEVGEWVVHEASRQLAEWHSQYSDRLRVSVNVSPHQISNPGFTERITRALSIASVKPESIEFEITEGVLISDPARAIEVLQEWKEVGARIVVDDFGTGYSSLSYLHRFPLDVLKLDRSFVRQMIQEKNSLAIVRTIIALAHNLGLSVVAEGVEAREELELLASEGCDEMQGYYFSRPIPAEQFRDLLVTGKRLERPEPGRPTSY